MRAAQVTRTDGPDGLELCELAEPETKEGHVVVQVRAAGVSFPDLLLSRGLYQARPELPFVPGSEVAGTVLSAGPGSRHREGDRVAAFCGLGGFAEQVAVPEELTFPLPAKVGYETGAALLMNVLTCHFALVRRGRLQPGETVLVHGAGGGIGTAAVQLAKAFGARVMAVASTPEKAEAARRAGADHVLAPEGFKDAAREVTGGRGVDLVVDPVGGELFTDSLRSLAPEGRLLVVGFASGEIPTVRVNRLLFANTAVVGVGWGAFLAGVPSLAASQWEELLPLIEDGRLSPPVGRVFSLEEAAEALRLIERREATGKVVLRLPGTAGAAQGSE